MAYIIGKNKVKQTAHGIEGVALADIVDTFNTYEDAMQELEKIKSMGNELKGDWDVAMSYHIFDGEIDIVTIYMEE